MTVAFSAALPILLAEMRRDVIESLRCPACGRVMDLRSDDGEEIVKGSLACECGESFEIADGIPDLVYPEKLPEIDAAFKEEYDSRAGRYDTDLDWQFDVFKEDKGAVRSRMADMMELDPGATVLEIGAGTGEDSVHILDRIGAGGTFYAQELSTPMLKLAREKLSSYDTDVEYVLSNASYLPFKDDMFDAAFHFGGLNGFGELRRALEEATRVVRPGGKVVLGDEGIAPWLRRKLYGRILIRTNKLYKHRPPLELLPVDVREVGLHWLLGDAFYVIEYRVGEGPLPMDLDLPMPRKGDTLRSRFYGKG